MNIQRWMGSFLAVLLLAACNPTSSDVVTSPGAESPAPSITKTSPPPQEAPVRREITYDPYLIPANLEPLFDDELRAEYARLVDAIMERKDSIRIDKGVEARDDGWLPGAVVSQLNPVGALAGKGTLPDGKTLVFEYHFDEAEHERMVASIAPRIEQLVADLIPEQANDLDAALAVYEHLARTTTYTQDGVLTGSYGVLIDSQGMCGGFASGMVWLLSQAGVDIASAVEWVAPSFDVEGHVWVLMSLDGEFSHLDPTFENGETMGMRLTRFGMTDEQRRETMNGPFTYIPDADLAAPPATDARFAPLQDAARFSLDPVGHVVTLRDENGAESRYSTETLSLID